MIVGIGGTSRAGSTGELALRHCLAIAESAGAHAEFLNAQKLQLPMYDPAQSEPSPTVRRFLDLVHSADALVIASPAYHADVSGLIKNTLDHLEKLRMADPPYLDGKIVACITTSRGAQGGAHALASLRSVIHALRGWPTPLGVVIDTSTASFDPDGEPLKAAVRTQLQTMMGQALSTIAPRTSGYNGQRGPGRLAARDRNMHNIS